MSRRLLAAPLAIAVAALAAAPAVATPTLEARALLPFDATAPAPFNGAPTLPTDPPPTPTAGARQPVGGFSALLAGSRKGTYLAMPDNGFGNKGNSRHFLLRVYTVKPDWRTARGGSGDVDILSSINLRDPDEKIPFAIVNEGTAERYLTGGDFDIESFRIDRARHAVVRRGVRPVPPAHRRHRQGARGADPAARRALARLPGPPGRHATTSTAPTGSRGWRSRPTAARSTPRSKGRSRATSPPCAACTSSTSRSAATSGGFKQYRVADPTYLVSDLTALDDKRFVALERDNFEGAAAVHKRGFVVDRKTLAKREVVNLLALRDPAEISLRDERPGDIGLGDPFSMPYVTIEAVLPIGKGELAIVNDTNFGSNGRNPAIDDDSDFIRVKVPRLRG